MPDFSYSSGSLGSLCYPTPLIPLPAGKSEPWMAGHLWQGVDRSTLYCSCTTVPRSTVVSQKERIGVGWGFFPGTGFYLLLPTFYVSPYLLNYHHECWGGWEEKGRQSMASGYKCGPSAAEVFASQDPW